MGMLPKPVLEQKLLGGIPALTDEALFQACGVRIAFTGRAGGVSRDEYAALNTGSHVDDDPDAVAENRRRIIAALGASEAAFICPNQVHGTNIVIVREVADHIAAQAQMAMRANSDTNVEKDPGETPTKAAAGADDIAVSNDAVAREASDFEAALEKAKAGADAIVVEVANVVALMSFADCMPVIIVSPSGRFAVAHAGWRGAVAGIAGIAARTLERLDTEAANSYTAADYNVYLGPHIRSECFEVGAEVAEQFIEAFGDGVVTSEGHVDLVRAVTCDLARAGIVPKRIADAQICTKCHPDQYFSYRATGGSCGRHAAVAVRC